MSDSIIETPPAAGLWRRAVGIVISPVRTMREVIVTPQPAGILFLVCLVLGLATALPLLTERGRLAALEMQVQQIELTTHQPVSADVYSELEQRSASGAYLAFLPFFVFVPATAVIFAGLCSLAFSLIFRDTATFKQVLAVVAHAHVIAALSAILSAPIQFAQGKLTPAGPFTLGALAPMLEPGTFLADWLASLNVFTVWQLVVTAVGLAVLYRRNAFGIAVALISGFLLLTAAMLRTGGGMTPRPLP